MKKQYGCIVPVSMLSILILLGLLAFPQLAQAQSQRNPCIYLSTTNQNCIPVGSSNTGVGNSPMPVGGLATAAAPTYVEGMPGSLSFDLTGALRTTAAGGGGGSVTQGTTPWVTSIQQGGSNLSATNGIFSNQLQGNAALSATNGAFTNVLQGNAVLSNTNPLPTTTQGAVNITLADCSGTITSGGVAQNAFTAAATRHGFTIANIDTSEVLWISFTTTAAASGTGSYPLGPADTTTFSSLASFTSPPGMGINTALSVIAATTSHKFTCTVW